MPKASLSYRHVDVFSERPYSGNGLIVFFGGIGRPDEELLAITGEMRQFESIFLGPEPHGRELEARIFTVEEELLFAGHPMIGAAAAAHERWGAEEDEVAWAIAAGGRSLDVRSRRRGDYYAATMNQGPAALEQPLGDAVAGELAAALGVADARRADLPLQVVTTGLPYLIVPVTGEGLAGARISVGDLEQRLAAVGAKFVYVLDPELREGRTWDNAGAVEDVATGSAAGPVAGYLSAHGVVEERSWVLRQGRFTGRPSEIAIETAEDGDIWVGGPVAPVAAGQLGSSA